MLKKERKKKERKKKICNKKEKPREGYGVWACVWNMSKERKGFENYPLRCGGRKKKQGVINLYIHRYIFVYMFVCLCASLWVRAWTKKMICVFLIFCMCGLCFFFSFFFIIWNLSWLREKSDILRRVGLYSIWVVFEGEREKRKKEKNIVGFVRGGFRIK